jgi:hypothetical protein
MEKALSKTAAIKMATNKVSTVEHLGDKWVVSGPTTCMELSDMQHNYEEATWARRKWIAEIALDLMGYDMSWDGDAEKKIKLDDFSQQYGWTVSNIVDHII